MKAKKFQNAIEAVGQFKGEDLHTVYNCVKMLKLYNNLSPNLKNYVYSQLNDPSEYRKIFGQNLTNNEWKFLYIRSPEIILRFKKMKKYISYCNPYKEHDYMNPHIWLKTEKDGYRNEEKINKDWKDFVKYCVKEEIYKITVSIDYSDDKELENCGGDLFHFLSINENWDKFEKCINKKEENSSKKRKYNE